MGRRLVWLVVGGLLAACGERERGPSAAEKALEDVMLAQAKFRFENGAYATSLLELGAVDYQPVEGVVVTLRSLDPRYGYTVVAEGGGATCHLEFGTRGPTGEAYDNSIRCE